MVIETFLSDLDHFFYAFGLLYLVFTSIVALQKYFFFKKCTVDIAIRL